MNGKTDCVDFHDFLLPQVSKAAAEPTRAPYSHVAPSRQNLPRCFIFCLYAPPMRPTRSGRKRPKRKRWLIAQLVTSSGSNSLRGAKAVEELILILEDGLAGSKFELGAL